ncbi:MAG: flagellar basal body rod modification protein [Rhodobacteraceae bacterium]|nr:flagellar basal body rod modification protein [Paracoccaceae bacterium]
MQIGQVNQSVTPASALEQGVTSSSVISSDFETFLLMLTTQMENQDPLNPIESSDYAVQLATFSSVEQQVLTNDLLSNLSEQMGLMGMAQLAGWVGMEARAAAPAYFDGAPITLSPNPAAIAQEAVLVVRDASGNEVERIEIEASTGPVIWAGVDEDGNPRTEGLYSFELESYAHDDLIATTQVDVYSRISEARNEGGQTILILEGGVEVPASAVNALREAS